MQKNKTCVMCGAEVPRSRRNHCSANCMIDHRLIVGSEWRLIQEQKRNIQADRENIEAVRQNIIDKESLGIK